MVEQSSTGCLQIGCSRGGQGVHQIGGLGVQRLQEAAVWQVVPARVEWSGGSTRAGVQQYSWGGS